jgi:TonB family protein
MLDLLRTDAPAWFSVEEVAQAAGVPIEGVWRLIEKGQAAVHEPKRLMSAADAVHLVRVLQGSEPESANRFPFNKIPTPPRKTTRSVVTSGAVHALGVLLLIVSASIGLADSTDSKHLPKPDEDVKFVYLMMPGPGGGGGGGGLREPKPVPPAKKKALVTFKKAAPVPPARPKAAPPQPTPVPPQPPARVEPKPIDKPTPLPPPPAVQAPVKSIPADPIEVPGVPTDAPPAPPSRGPGNAGGVGSGSGQGVGSGDGGGIGPGSGGGTGGGPYQPGAGIDPPTLVREVRPSYTDTARRQAIEGDVVLEIVVRSDGSVGNVRVRQSLGGGLEQKAIEAVRQWRFTPAKRKGVPVDVVVDVAVEFKLR